MIWRQWRARLADLVPGEESPWRTALALAVGVFLSFTPFWGFQTLLALVLATVLGLNRAVTVAGTWLNLPWFAPFVYTGAVKLGALMLPDLAGLAGLSVYLLVGSITLGLVAGVLTWIIVFGAMRLRRHRRRAGGDPGESQRAA